MSRGLQMLVEEGSIPHALMLCGASGAKTVHGFIKKRKKLRIPWAESSEIAENCKFRGQNHQKSLKTTNSVGGIIRNRRKQQIPWTESSEIDENCKFRGRNHQKSTKTANSVDGIIKKRQKLRFGHGRKIENSENCISATAER